MDLASVHLRREDRDVGSGGQPRRRQIQSSQGAFPDAALGSLSIDDIENMQQRSGSKSKALAGTVTVKDGLIATCAYTRTSARLGRGHTGLIDYLAQAGGAAAAILPSVPQRIIPLQLAS